MIKKAFLTEGKTFKKTSFSVVFKYFISPSIKLYFIHSCYNVSVVLMWGVVQCLLSLLQPPSNIGPCQSLCWSPLLNWWTNLVRVYANHHYQTDEQILFMLFYVDHHYQTDEQILSGFMLTTIIKLMNRSCQSLCWSPLSNWSCQTVSWSTLLIFWTNHAGVYVDNHCWTNEQNLGICAWKVVITNVRIFACGRFTQEPIKSAIRLTNPSIKSQINQSNSPTTPPFFFFSVFFLWSFVGDAPMAFWRCSWFPCFIDFSLHSSCASRWIQWFFVTAVRWY